MANYPRLPFNMKLDENFSML